MRGHRLYLVVLAAGVMTAGAGLMVALGYLEQPGPFNQAILGAIGGGMTGAGFRRWRKRRSSVSGHAGGTRQRETSAINDQRREAQAGRGQGVD